MNTNPSSEPQEDIGRKIASDFVYAVHKWRGMSAGFMQAQVRRLAKPINAALAAERDAFAAKHPTSFVRIEQVKELLDEVRKPLVEALQCAEYAMTHPESDQQFALNAVRDAIGRADSALAQVKEGK